MGPNELRSLQPEDLIGTWQLISAQARSASGELFYPYGETPIGQLMYDAAGAMSVILMQPGRTLFASDDPLGGSAEEYKQAFASFNAYMGTYQIDAANHTVTHHIVAAKFPNWVGTKQVRHVTRSEHRLQLDTPPLLTGGVEWIYTLIWKPAG